MIRTHTFLVLGARKRCSQSTAKKWGGVVVPLEPDDELHGLVGTREVVDLAGAPPVNMPHPFRLHERRLQVERQ